ncbi:M23 family metallopeptidase [Oscillospiraceae bacterium MB24-C1]|nr:M23 family metallopeptidase [Oscillospiraceae bacterium MB24-C1]
MSEEKYQAEARHFGHAPQDVPVEDTTADEAEAATPSSRLKQTMRRQVRKPDGVKIRLRDDKPRLRLRSPKQRLKYTQAESPVVSPPMDGKDMIRPKGSANIQPENKNRASNLKTAQRRHRQLKITEQQKSSRPSNMEGEVRQEPQSTVTEYREPAQQSIRFGNATDRFTVKDAHLVGEGTTERHTRLRFSKQNLLHFKDKLQSADTLTASLITPAKRRLRLQQTARLRLPMGQLETDGRNSQQQRLRFTGQSRLQPDGAATSTEVSSGYKKRLLYRPNSQFYGDSRDNRHRLKLPGNAVPDRRSGSQPPTFMAGAHPQRFKPKLQLVRPTYQLENSEQKLKDIQPSKSWILQYQYENLRFRAESEHWRFGERQAHRIFRFSDSGKKAPSRLKFEEDRIPHSSKLKFEEDKISHKRGWGSSLSATKQETERAINELADQSENEGIQSANQHRKWQTTGLGEGWRAGGAWRQGHDQRVVQREIKRATREAKDKAYELRHGKPSRSAELRKKLMIRKRQMENFAERKAGKQAVQNTERFIAFVAEKAAQLIRLAVAYIAGPAIGVIAIYAAVAVLVLIMFSAFMDSATAAITSYAAPDTEIEAASSYYTKLEAELDKEIKNISTAWEWQHIDQFHYDLDDIEHDPFQLMGYLSVKYPGFTFSDVKTELDYIFDQRYTLTTHQWYEWRGQKPHRYKYYHLDVTLRAKPMEPILLKEMAKDTKNDLVSWYGVLMETKGAHQAYANPFDIDWSGNVSSLYGYRVDPIGEKELQQHRGVDIAMPTGTPIRAGLSGTVRYVGHDNIMGNYIILDADGVERTMKYGHCDEVRVSVGEKVAAGETVIGTVGNSGQSTGPHLHLEILENGEYVNPIYSLNYKEKTS